MVKFNFNPGDKIEITTKKEALSGLFMPSKENTFILKLDNGYNLGIDKKNIKKVKLLSKYKEKKPKSSKVKQNSKLPTITILHTGGTIASKVDYETGGVIARFSPEELLEMFPELKKIVNLKSRLVSNMWSEDLNFQHYNLLAKEVEKEVKAGADGVIITHGTDTLHYTSSALAFILENLKIPVILVGSQRSSDRGSSDAALNLICACNFIANSKFQDVAICMHSSMEDESCYILPATKSRKLHSSRRDAFKAINTDPIALVDKQGKIEYSQKVKQKKGKLNLRLFKEVKVGILKAHPNMLSKEVSFYKDYDGLILEGTGLGHFPINKTDSSTTENEKVFTELKKLSKKIPVVMTSQCIFGRINMNVYTTGRKLQEIGVLGNGLDMTTETAFIKLAWLLSNFKKQDVFELISENISNEINERIKDDFLE
ncbi:MAG: Glu-tRNA(Gln) amidotransferase subunit GatD [Nanoarchaeota archaeon]|nr:Glu-tRNA(Gln) amidotransferase subunit GatD [Nanoarchaeota archaeon]MBU1444745.1 Glu-tRNA(Gln) amidotransferase subunit GatD [Nanoarchaeota archaeon]MBU2406640.1 Glu-tRNA(Gln) amidotransferase subunit GatD [Nanoarchaeota archaeon]MBU2420108.1 Glu-tRNA(Gln) amidotransferase subunit GatD [Nanoarchaeota archaeon]MBU2474874.1 Glu-tRNA(Gln) amidotransferase subunit GatD [Nanoarchaeota archaeon]